MVAMQNAVRDERANSQFSIQNPQFSSGGRRRRGKGRGRSNGGGSGSGNGNGGVKTKIGRVIIVCMIL